jgi:hypothetical protein
MRNIDMLKLTKGGFVLVKTVESKLTILKYDSIKPYWHVWHVCNSEKDFKARLKSYLAQRFIILL